MIKNKKFDIGYDYKLRRFIRDKETDETLNILDSCHLLNALHEENEQLKHQNELLSDELEQCKAVINKKWSEYLKKKELME